MQAYEAFVATVVAVAVALVYLGVGTIFTAAATMVETSLAVHFESDIVQNTMTYVNSESAFRNNQLTIVESTLRIWSDNNACIV